MKRLIMALMFLLILGPPVLAMNKMSNNELKKITAQIASSVGHTGTVASPVMGGYELGSNLAEGYGHAGNLTTAAGPVGVAQTAGEPVRIVTQVISDANGFKSGVSLGFF